MIHFLKYLGFFVESEERYGARLVWKNQVLGARCCANVIGLEPKQWRWILHCYIRELSEFLNVCEEMQVEGEDEVGMTFSLANSYLLRNGNEGATDFVTRGEN